MIIDLAYIAAVAQRNRDDYAAFEHYVRFMWEREGRSPQALDALVDEIAAEVVPQIDCTACANCCQTIPVGLVPADITRLVEVLDQDMVAVCAQYVDHEAGQRIGEWGVLRNTPCPWLRDRLCMVYAHRPQSCRTYPALTPDFLWLLGPILAGVGRCPIIFNVIERLKTKLAW